MNTKQKEELLKENLFHDIEFRINQNKINGQLFFGSMHKDVFKDLSSSCRIGKLDDKMQYHNLGFYVKPNGFPTKIDLENDNIYQEGGRLVVERQ